MSKQIGQPVLIGLRVDPYDFLIQRLETAVNYGWHRAHKHNDAPDEATIKNQILEALTNELCECLLFKDEDAEEVG